MIHAVRASIALMAYDGILHIATLIVPRQWDEDGNNITNLPWILYPTFPSWFTYDLFWAGVHLAAAAVLAAYVIRRAA